MTHAIPLYNNPARLAAIAAGEKTFEPGHLCAHSHSSRRYTISGQCCTCTDLKNTKRKTGRSRGRPSQNGWKAPSRTGHVAAIKIAKRRFNRAAFANKLADYRHSVEGRARSRYCDSLLTKVPQ